MIETLASSKEEKNSLQSHSNIYRRKVQYRPAIFVHGDLEEKAKKFLENVLQCRKVVKKPYFYILLPIIVHQLGALW